jgi:hypothetical protein
MNWNRPDFMIDNGDMYSGSRFLGAFSSTEAALAGLRMMREDKVVPECKYLTDSDLTLLELIDEED